ncbi:MAG TPA: glycosyltransferase family 39 protein [Terracidiphilus sp.]|jgi:hypothetical protein
MSSASKSRLAGLGCVFIFLLCALATYPIAEIGITDDWSYVQSARLLAQTGHLIYNGCATAMVGWQLYLGALFIKLFGPSFTAIRSSTVLMAMATAFLAHRTLVRAGVNAGNAFFGTLVLVLSPLFMPLAFTFMTDVGGLFCVVLCLYACLRALQAKRLRSVLFWLTLAAVTNAVGGTARQIAWVGVLVMFPCTIWLLRRRPFVRLAGAALYFVSILFIVGILHWFAHQPYSVPEPLFPASVHWYTITYCLHEYAHSAASLAMFLLPVLIAFASPAALKNRRAFLLVPAGGLLAIVICDLAFGPFHVVATRLFPYLGYTITDRGMLDWPTDRPDRRPILLNYDMRLVSTACLLLAAVCFVCFLYLDRQRLHTISPTADQPSWKILLVLLVPFSVAYLALFWPQAAFVEVYDRYLLPLVFIGILLLLRLFQDRVRPNLPFASYVVLFFFTAFAVAGTHDAFSMFRARNAAINEVIRAGVPPDTIDGGFEYDAMLQVERYGYLNNDRVRFPGKIYVDYPNPFPKNCAPDANEGIPVIVPGYSISWDPHACGGISAFAPVEYHQWLAPHTVTLYIDRTFNGASDKP